MTPENIEALMTEMKLNWNRIIPKMWAVQDDTNEFPQVAVSIEKSEKKDSHLVKFIVFICDVPVNAKPSFFKEFLKLNFIVEHGTFAMESMNEMSFIDTLELENLDPNEFMSTISAMRNAPRLFRKRYNIDSYSF